MLRQIAIATAAALFLCPPLAAQQPKQNREQKVLEDRKKIEAEGFWIYNDLNKGLEEARKTGKPLFVIMRCIPCVECVKLDDDVVNQDERIKALLPKFVCVRIVSTNGLDLSLFQFDYDQSFAGFFLNADKTVYGRFGTRSHRTTWADDVSVEGLSKALQGALDLHAQYPKNKDALAGKTGPQPEVPSPEKFPSMKGKYESTIKFETGVVQSCIHCHQVGEAQKTFHRAREGAIPEQLVFPYPHPKSQGLILDPKEKANVFKVETNSPAAKAGFQAGDVITALNGQPLLSMADVQWVLHRTPADGGDIRARIERGGKPVEFNWTLPAGWRQRDDISWRASSWALRRMGTGAMNTEQATADERKKANVPDGKMALRVKFVGQYAPYDQAKRAGLLAGDIVTSFDGRTDLLRETDLLAYGALKKKPGDKVEVKWVRNGKEMSGTITMLE